MAGVSVRCPVGHKSGNPALGIDLQISWLALVILGKVQAL
jgi:hypothetical protein